MTDGQRQASAPDSYYPWFDWLRFVLANVVMLVHFGIIRGWSHAGDFAVQAFFALSGWLIGGLLLEQSRSGSAPRGQGAPLKVVPPPIIPMMM